MIRFGMSPIEAIRSATVKAVALLGMEEEIGEIRSGMFANLIAVKVEPLSDINLLQDVRAVVK